MKALLSRGFCFSVCVACLAGCGFFGSKKEGPQPDFKTQGASESTKTALSVPPDLIAPTLDPRFAFDEGKSSATFSAYSKEGKIEAESTENVLPKLSKVRMDRAGSQRWLVVPGTPDKVWGELRKFWVENGFVIKQDSPDVGVMETDWAESRAKLPEEGIRGLLTKTLSFLYSTSELDKFRARVEKSAEDGMIEVYISHRGMEEVAVDQTTRWQPRPVDADLEAKMMRRFAMRFGVEEKLAKQLVPDAGAKEVQAARAALIDEGLSLEVNGTIEKVWRQVGLALDRKGVVVEDRDRSAYIYFVRYLDTSEDPKTGKSWMSSLAFWRKKESFTNQFRIRMEATENNTVEIYVLDRDDDDAAEEPTREILKLLYDELK